MIKRETRRICFNAEPAAEPYTPKNKVKSLFQQIVDFIAGPNDDRGVLIRALKNPDYPPSSAPARKLFPLWCLPLSDQAMLDLLMESFRQDSILKLYGSHIVDNEFMVDKIVDVSNLLVLALS